MHSAKRHNLQLGNFIGNTSFQTISKFVNAFDNWLLTFVDGLGFTEIVYNIAKLQLPRRLSLVNFCKLNANVIKQ